MVSDIRKILAGDGISIVENVPMETLTFSVAGRAKSADLASLADSTKGAALMGFSGAPVARWLETIPRAAAASGVAASNADNLSQLNAAIAAAIGALALPLGDVVVSAAPTNTRGVNLVGPGRVLLPVTGGYRQLNTYADRDSIAFGREYMAAFHRRIIDGAGCHVVLTGDSTTEGNSVTGEWIPSALVSAIARDRGVYYQVTHNRGQSGKHSGDWVSTYVSGDITNGGDTPHLMIVRWGINDPYFGRSLTQFITSMRAGLAAVRAALPVSITSILLMAPNSTSDTPGGRDERWYEQVVPALRAMAREYQCAFFDTYAWCRDARGAAGLWMDNPFADGRAVHPLDVMNAAIYSGVADLIYPAALAPVRKNALQNLSSVDQTRTASSLPAAYAPGVTVNRAQSGDGWPLDGGVLTQRHVDGTYCLQWNWGSSNASSEVQFRVGQGTDWMPWASIGAPPGISTLTLSNSWVSYAAQYTPRARKTCDGLVQLEGLIKNGTTTVDTIITTLPAGKRPVSQTRWFTLPTDTTPATLYVTESGEVRVKVCPSNGYLALDGMSFVAA